MDRFIDMSKEIKRGYISGPTTITGIICYDKNGVGYYSGTKNPILIKVPDDEWIDLYGSKEWKEYKEKRDKNESNI